MGTGEASQPIPGLTRHVALHRTLGEQLFIVLWMKTREGDRDRLFFYKK